MWGLREQELIEIQNTLKAIREVSEELKNSPPEATLKFLIYANIVEEGSTLENIKLINYFE